MKGVEAIEERKTIAEWSRETGIIVIDPDGFDREDEQLYERLFTREEFMRGAMFSTIEFSTASPHVREFILDDFYATTQDKPINAAKG